MPMFSSYYRRLSRKIRSRLGRDTVLRLDLPHEWHADSFHAFMEKAVQAPLRVPKPPKKARELPFKKNAGPFALRTAMIFGLLFLVNNAPAYWSYVKASLVSMEKPALESQAVQVEEPQEWTEIPLLDFPIISYEDTIRIPSLNINAPIVLPEMSAEALELGDWAKIEEAIHDSLAKGVVHYPGTAKPFEKGNFFLTGHSSNVLWEPSPYNTVFARLPKIKVGDEIVIDYKQKRYKYLVSSTKEVSPQTVEVLSQEGPKRLTLMTCTPVGTTLKRFIVEAEPAS